MPAFSYLSGLTSIVLALGLARLLTGFGRVLQARGSVKNYWVHLVWGFNLFLYIVLIWWILFRWQGWVEWNYFLFLFLLASPIVTFLQAVLLFPESVEQDRDLKQYFFHNRRWFFVLGALLAPLDAIDTALKGWDHLSAQGLLYPITITLLFSLNLIAALTAREGFHKFYALLFLGYLILFIAINLRMLT